MSNGVESVASPCNSRRLTSPRKTRSAYLDRENARVHRPFSFSPGTNEAGEKERGRRKDCEKSDKLDEICPDDMIRGAGRGS